MVRTRILSLAAGLAVAAAMILNTAAQENSMTDLPEPSESGRVPVNGVEIWYQTYGEGEPLILIHGGLGTAEMFGPNIAALAEGRRVIGVDLQGHGGTGPLGRPMSFEAVATDIAELIGALGYEKADVLGYSLGGAVALRIAIDHPAVVDRLVMVSATEAFKNWHSYNFEGMKGMGADPAGTAESLIGTPMHDAYVAKAPGGAESWNDAIAEVVTFVAQDYDWSAEIGKVEAPTLLVYADWDAVRIAAATGLYEALGGGAQDAGWDRAGMGQNHLAIIPNTTHYEIVTAPGLAEVAVPFLDGYADSSGQAEE